MKLRRHRNDLWFALGFVLVTLGWGFIGLPWVFAPALAGFGGLGWDPNIQGIRTRFPGFLVDPATMENTAEDVWMAWFAVEIKTRLAIVIGSWLLVVAGLWFLDWRSRRTEVRRITT